jgi:hypothetical protein
MSRRSIIAACVLLPIAAVAANAAPTYQPFPPGYGYMEQDEIQALLNAVNPPPGGHYDHHVVREHGWKLWAGINQPDADGKWPIWYTWCNTTTAFAPPPPACPLLLGASTSSAPARSGGSLIRLNAGVRGGEPGAKEIPVNVKEVPCYPIPRQVKRDYPHATDPNVCGPNSICDGLHFQFNGDIMIATESLSQEAFDWIRGKSVYQQVTLDEWHNITGAKDLDLPQRYIVTKHMFWPVKAGRLSAVPVWHDYHDGKFSGYAGYEKWPDLVAIDPRPSPPVGTKAAVSYLHGIKTLQHPIDSTYTSCKNPKPFDTVHASATVHGLNEFYYHQVTKDDWQSFNEADRAILNAASYWAYDEPFEPGDYLVTVAMHINTKEIPTWALQSVWWSDVPDAPPYASDRPKMPSGTTGPWDHYLLVDGYGIPDEHEPDRLPVAFNPYIELVSHKVGTDCNNCHMRAGWPAASQAGTASYQNPDCPISLEKFSPDNPCFKNYTRTDFQWIIPDRAK